MTMAGRAATGARAPLSGLARSARLLRFAMEYEFRKVSVFRVGFLVREVLRGVVHPLVMICVYLAIYRQSGAESLRGWTFDELVRYLLLVAVFHKLVFHHRALDLGTQIFQGYLTKYLVMPFRFFVLPLGRWVQFTLLQLAVSLGLWLLGALLLPAVWPHPASPEAACQALVLVLLGSFCFLQLFFIIHCLAFWLDVIWTLLVMSYFVSSFVGGVMIPVSQMPAALRESFRWLFPYWTVSAPIEIFMGRLGRTDFLHGLAVLALSAVLLELVRRFTWRRGTRRYAGSGM